MEISLIIFTVLLRAISSPITLRKSDQFPELFVPTSPVSVHAWLRTCPSERIPEINQNPSYMQALVSQKLRNILSEYSPAIYGVRVFLQDVGTLLRFIDRWLAGRCRFL